MNGQRSGTIWWILAAIKKKLRIKIPKCKRKRGLLNSYKIAFKTEKKKIIIFLYSQYHSYILTLRSHFKKSVITSKIRIKINNKNYKFLFILRSNQ